MVTHKPPCVPPGSSEGSGEPRRAPEEDLSDLRYLFVSPPKFVVGTTVPDPVYFQLLDYPGGISKFYEDAIGKFDGDLEALMRASAVFCDNRKRSRQTVPIRSANGRISEAAQRKIQSITNSLKHIRGMSVAKVLAGLIQDYVVRLN